MDDNKKEYDEKRVRVKLVGGDKIKSITKLKQVMFNLIDKDNEVTKELNKALPGLTPESVGRRMLSAFKSLSNQLHPVAYGLILTRRSMASLLAYMNELPKTDLITVKALLKGLRKKQLR